MVPHNHIGDSFDQSSKTTFSEAESIIDYIKIAFLVDLGDGHLDSFEQGEKYDFNSEFQIETSSKTLPISYFIPESIISQNLILNNNQYTNCVPFLRQYFLSHIDFRGPPFNV
jgi:hypothetical protein